MLLRSAALGLVMAAVLAPSSAQVRRWVDETGRVHYGDRALASNATTLRIRSESATAPVGPSTGAASAPGRIAKPVPPEPAGKDRAQRPPLSDATPQAAPARPRPNDAPRT